MKIYPSMGFYQHNAGSIRVPGSLASRNRHYDLHRFNNGSSNSNSKQQQLRRRRPSPAVLLDRRRQRGRRGRPRRRVLDADQGYPHALQLGREVSVEAERVVWSRDALALNAINTNNKMKKSTTACIRRGRLGIYNYRTKRRKRERDRGRPATKNIARKMKRESIVRSTREEPMNLALAPWVCVTRRCRARCQLRAKQAHNTSETSTRCLQDTEHLSASRSDRFCGTLDRGSHQHRESVVEFCARQRLIYFQ